MMGGSSSLLGVGCSGLGFGGLKFCAENRGKHTGDP